MGEIVFKALLRLYPGAFRIRYGEEQLEFVRREREELGADVGKVRLLAFWFTAYWGVVPSALRVRVRALLARGNLVGRILDKRGGPRRPAGERSLLESVSQDIRFAARSLGRQPAFTGIIIGVLGLGIGSSTTLFSAVNGVLLRPLPYPEEGRLAFLGSMLPDGTRLSGVSLPELMDIIDQVESVEAVAAARGLALDLVGEGDPERVAMSSVSRDYFRVLGISPAIGPGFRPEDHQRSDTRVIMISDGLWRRRWGGDPDIVGRTILASDGSTPELVSYTVVGVLPVGFQNPTPLENPYSRLPPADLWAPLPMNAEAYNTPRTNWNVRAVARIRPGASLASLNAELEALARSLKETYPEAHVRGETYLGLGARFLRDEIVGSRRKDLLVLLGATGILLLIACANVAGLLLARALDRAREMGLRTALGAGRRRLFQQLLTESLVLASLGGALGMGMSILGIRAFRVFGPRDFPRLAEIAPDLRVIGFGVLIALLTGLLFGVGPALAGSSERTGSGLSRGARGSTSGRRTLRVRSGLVTFEVALALVLLTGCGLLTRSVIRLQHTDPGIETEKLAIVQVRLLPSYDQDEERAGFFSELRQRLEALPGVVSASFVPDPPMGFNQWAPTLWRETDPIEEPFGWANAHTVGLDYFRTLGIPVVRGRVFTETDHAQGPPVVVLSQALADTLWPGEDPLGKRLDASGRREGPWITVVGIVGDIRQRSLASRLSRDLYLPYDQAAVSGGQFMAIRTAGDPLVLAEVFRRTVWDLDDDVPIPEITTMEARVDATLRLPRFRTLLLAFFAGAALILAGAGIYGTLLYTTGKRTPEVGIRMALGAEARDVMGLVVRQGFAPVLVGLGLGLAGSLFATRVLESVLFDVAANDPATFVMVTVGLSFVSFLACLVPARKASRVDPQEALRAD